MSDKLLPLTAAAERNRGKPGRPLKPKPEADPVVLPPRLLDVAGAARYLSISPSRLRTLVWSGMLRRVRVPLPNGGEMRKILLDMRDLDVLVERWKEDGS